MTEPPATAVTEPPPAPPHVTSEPSRAGRWRLLLLAASLIYVFIGAYAFDWAPRLASWLRNEKPPALEAHVFPLPAAPDGLTWVEVAGMEDGYPSRVPSVLGLHALLRNRRFAVLTAELEKLQLAFEMDPRKEYWAVDSFQAFGVADPAFGPLIDAWIAASPASFVPLLARAEHRSGVAWHYRGFAWASETPYARFAAFDRMRALAAKDAEAVIVQNPRVLAAHVLLVTDAQQPKERSDRFDSAEPRLPPSFLLQRAYIAGEQPRWGGSYERMEELAARAMSRAADNPRFKLLAGFVEWARAQDALTAKSYAAAVAAADRALQHGQHFAFHRARGDAKLALGEPAAALAAYDRAIQLKPENDELWSQRASALWELKRFGDAGEAFLMALRLNPAERLEQRRDYAGALVTAGKVELVNGRAREALAAFDNALLLDGANLEARRIKEEILVRHATRAPSPELSAMIERADREGTFEAYLALDDALVKQQRFAEIIAAWTRYLERNPRDGRALNERAGAYTHLRRYRDALVDTERACDLGESRACEHTPRLREIVRRTDALPGPRQ